MAEERMLNDEILLGLIKANSGGGGGGTTDYDDLNNKPQIGGVTLSGNKSASDLGLATAAEVEGKQDTLTAGANINMTGDVVKAGVVEVVEPDMTVYGNSTESGSKTYTIETTGVYEIFYCLSLQSTVSVTLPNNANVLFESDLTVSSHPVKHIVAELHEGDTVTIAQTPSQWNAVVSGVLKLDAISVVDVAHTGSIADNTITYTLPNDNKYYLVVGACVGKPTGNNAVDSTSGGTPEITRTLTGSGVRFRSVVVKGSDSPSFSFYGYDGGVASIIAYEIEFEEGNWDYNLATKNYVDTALSGKQDILTFDDTPTDNSNNPVKSNGVYDALATKANASDVTTALATKQDATDNNLTTTSKTVVGAVNELKSGLIDLSEEVNGDATTYPYADVITIEDAVPANVADCTVKIEPEQDLHGQSAPYVGGAGKNKLPMTLANLKSANTAGTWNDNTYTVNGLTFTILTDDGDNVVGIKVTGTASAQTVFRAGTYTPTAETSVKFNGVTGTGSGSTYSINMQIGSAFAGDVYSGDSVAHTIPANTNAIYLCVLYSGYECPSAGLMFYPMIRLSTETDATFAPYTNICPISGHTEASVQRDGKNLAITQSNNSVICHCLNGRTYTVSSDVTFSLLENGWGGNTLYTGSEPYTFTATKDFNLFFNGFNAPSFIQVEFGSRATEYVPYAGKTYTISLGDTIYGGTVDFDSGVMTVTHGFLDVTDFTYPGSSSSGGGLKWANATVDLKGTSVKSSMLEYKASNASWNSTTPCINSNSTERRIRVYVTETTESDFLTAYADLQVVYELATPTTIQLTPQQIQLLKGQNTITASTGDISVTVNGVSGSIGSVQEQANATDEALAELAEKLPTAPTTDGAYVLTVTVEDGTPTYSWESAE